ncbi:MAG: biopolymer transporter ExbD, partial [Deltaproteobacteria bacterium]|nr:biopolymer transporter ExbD [Deltaproteobacteria bacterium]
MPTPRHLRVFGLWVSTAVGCAHPTTSASPPAPTPTAQTTTEQQPPELVAGTDAALQALDQCSEFIANLDNVPASKRAQTLAAAGSGPAECYALLIGPCNPTPAPPGTGMMSAMGMLIDSCVDHYCPVIPSASRPTLCEDKAVGLFDMDDADAAQARAQRFIAQMLAVEYARPTTNGAIDRISSRFSSAWAAPVRALTVTIPMPAMEPEAPDPLQLHASIDRRGVTLDAPTMDPIFVARDDIDGLKATVAALGKAHPTAHGVVISASAEVPMQRLIETMDILRGEHCSTGTEDGCLFFKVT